TRILHCRLRPVTCPSLKREMSRSLLRFAAIRRIERMKDSACLMPKIHFVAAESIESKIGQIGQTQKAPGKLGSRFHSEHGFYLLQTAVWWKGVVVVQRSLSTRCMNYFSRVQGGLPSLPIATQMFGLNIE